MVLSLNYRRPGYTPPSSANSVNTEHTEKSGKTEVSTNSSTASYGIPEALSFDKIISKGTCPPVTLREFMDYLVFIEWSAENLQFYLWYQDYVKRFAALPDKERALSAPWNPESNQGEKNFNEKETNPKKISPDAAALLKGTDFDTTARVPARENGHNPFNTPPRTPVGGDRESVAPSTVGWSEDGSSMRPSTNNHGKKTAAAFEEVKTLQPFTIQPFREEISRIIAIYIAKDSSRMLNMAGKERQNALKALAVTTHPSAFHEVIANVEWTLRQQSHPNFIRWTICNGNKSRQVFAQGLGIAGIVAGLAYAIVITLSSANRGWRALAFLGFFIGIATLFAGWKGMCVVLHGMHHRHLRPWELFGDNDEAASDFEMKKNSFDSFGSKLSYEDEPWVAKYEKRNIIRKIFDREVWIEEPMLRQIQDTIFLQAILTGFLVGGVTTAIFLAVPKGNFF